MLQRMFSSAHVSLYRWSNGKIGGRFRNGDVLLLTTSGRKSGKKRTTPLIYVRDGNRLVLIASNGGSAKDPGWWRNLKHSPLAEVQLKDTRQTIYAERVFGSERERLWQLMTSTLPFYDGYAKKTTRDIPVVVLRPKLE